MNSLQTKLLAIVETWNLSGKPEFRGFRCANCQEYFTGQAWHHWLYEGGYVTPVHFCEKCEASLENPTSNEKPGIHVDRDAFKPPFSPAAESELDKISEKWDINVAPALKNFTCDACGKPLDHIDGRPQGWHIWRNKNGALIEYHLDKVCSEKLFS